MVNDNWLVVYLPLWKNMKVNGKDDNPYMKWKIKHVPNHQPDKLIFWLVVLTIEYRGFRLNIYPKKTNPMNHLHSGYD